MLCTMHALRMKPYYLFNAFLKYSCSGSIKHNHKWASYHPYNFQNPHLVDPLLQVYITPILKHKILLLCEYLFNFVCCYPLLQPWLDWHLSRIVTTKAISSLLHTRAYIKLSTKETCGLLSIDFTLNIILWRLNLMKPTLPYLSGDFYIKCFNIWST